MQHGYRSLGKDFASRAFEDEKLIGKPLTMKPGWLKLHRKANFKIEFNKIALMKIQILAVTSTIKNQHVVFL